MRDGRTWNGIRLLIVALVLSLVWKILYFPVWSIERGLSMHTLLSFVTVPSLSFVLGRLGPAAVIIGVLGVYLIERGRRGPTHGLVSWWDRERVAIASGGGAMSLGILVSIVGVDIGVWFLGTMGSGIAVLAAVGLYLFWTAERIAGTSVRELGFAAFIFAGASAALGLLTVRLLFPPISPRLVLDPFLTQAGAVLGAASLALWIVIYSRMLLGARGFLESVALPSEA